MLFDLLVRALPGQVCEGGGPVWVLSPPLCPPQALLSIVSLHSSHSHSPHSSNLSGPCRPENPALSEVWAELLCKKAVVGREGAFGLLCLFVGFLYVCLLVLFFVFEKIYSRS